eukprot:scaffold40743_cov60-Phaeocystis_antarctica.AAC.1
MQRAHVHAPALAGRAPTLGVLDALLLVLPVSLPVSPGKEQLLFLCCGGRVLVLRQLNPPEALGQLHGHEGPRRRLIHLCERDIVLLVLVLVLVLVLLVLVPVLAVAAAVLLFLRNTLGRARRRPAGVTGVTFSRVEQRARRAGPVGGHV